MSAVAARLAELGIELPSVVPPVAAYIPATVHGDLVYTSGQLPMVAGALPATGKVGGGVEASAAYGYARQCALNAIAAAAAAAVQSMSRTHSACTGRPATRRLSRKASTRAAGVDMWAVDSTAVPR